MKMTGKHRSQTSCLFKSFLVFQFRNVGNMSPTDSTKILSHFEIYSHFFPINSDWAVSEEEKINSLCTWNSTILLINGASSNKFE